LGQVEKVKKFTLLPREFSQEDRELTPTQKIRRKVINEHFKDVIEAMYQD
jgi:long-chain acyl-CoA synthetase